MDFEGAGRTLIQQTYDRFARFILPEHIYVSTLEAYVPLLQAQLPQLPRQQILAEPVRRGTLAPITWATTLITERDAEACIAVTPADQVIYGDQLFADDILHAAWRHGPCARHKPPPRAIARLQPHGGGVAERF